MWVNGAIKRDDGFSGVWDISGCEPCPCTVGTKVQSSARAANVLNYLAISSNLQSIYFYKACAYSDLP